MAPATTSREPNMTADDDDDGVAGHGTPPSTGARR